MTTGVAMNSLEWIPDCVLRPGCHVEEDNLIFGALMGFDRGCAAYFVFRKKTARLGTAEAMPLLQSLSSFDAWGGGRQSARKATADPSAALGMTVLYWGWCYPMSQNQDLGHPARKTTGASPGYRRSLRRDVRGPQCKSLVCGECAPPPQRAQFTRFGAPEPGTPGNSYTAVETLWKVETTVSNV